MSETSSSCKVHLRWTHASKKKKKEDNIYSKEDICCVDERLILKPSGVCQQNSLKPTDVIFQSLWSCLKGIDLSQKNKNIHHKKTEDNSTCSHFQRWKQTLFGISARWNTYRVRTPGGGAFLCRLCFHFWPRATPERHRWDVSQPPLTFLPSDLHWDAPKDFWKAFCSALSSFVTSNWISLASLLRPLFVLLNISAVFYLLWHSSLD